uniref:Uncharacterized protein n=1 Tax=Panagrolaimus davidi TaxID=227884 RepID=A0A914R8T8_9BILA
MFLEGLIAIIYVYLIGFIYSLKEFWKDRSEPITVEEVEKKSKSFNQSSEKVAVITGGDGQIGKELVKYLLKLGYIVCSVGFKNPIVSDNVKHYATDLSEKDQVIDAAKQICAGFPKGIHLVICNAGIMLHPFRLSETEHIEMHLAVNVLGHAILVENLQPVLKQLKNRVIFVSSATCRAGYFSKSANIKGFWQRKLNGYQAYANSKLLLSIFAEKLVEEEREK